MGIAAKLAGMVIRAASTAEHYYKTASTPLPENTFTKVSEQFPDLTFDVSFAASHMCYWGKQQYHAGPIKSVHSDTITSDYPNKHNNVEMTQYKDKNGELLNHTLQESDNRRGEFHA